MIAYIFYWLPFWIIIILTICAIIDDLIKRQKTPWGAALTLFVLALIPVVNIINAYIIMFKPAWFFEWIQRQNQINKFRG